MVKLLIADDEPYSLKGLTELFPWEEWGVRVAAAVHNGADALAFIRANPVDAVLSDIRMPQMDGLALSGILHEEFPRIRIILLTAFAEFEYVRKAMRSGVSEYLVKPVQQSALEKLFAGNPQSSAGTEAAAYHGYYEEIIFKAKKIAVDRCESASLENVAAELGFSPGHLSRIFHERSGATFSEYLLACRMNRAAELLKAGLPPEEAALRAGYNNTRNFNRVFKSFHGCSPLLFSGGKSK